MRLQQQSEEEPVKVPANQDRAWSEMEPEVLVMRNVMQTKRLAEDTLVASDSNDSGASNSMTEAPASWKGSPDHTRAGRSLRRENACVAKTQLLLPSFFLGIF